jgi:hypothetical protein
VNYWLNLFTGRTWQEFQAAGARVTGFREHNWNRARNIKPGDVFLCYLVGVKRWVGLLEVTGERFRDDSPIYSEETFPVRFPTRPLVVLPPEQGVEMASLEGKLSFFPAGTGWEKWCGHVRSSPTRYGAADGEAIAAAIRDAKANPVTRPVDPRQLSRSANLYKLRTKSGNVEIEAVVSVPSVEDEGEDGQPAPEGPTHTEIQWRLLDLGAQLGLKVWAPRSDRGRQWGTLRVGEVANLLQSLPTQFNDLTTQTIENIDVLWLSGQSIVAAFEVEHTSSVYSGLLRMSDLVLMQPNLSIKFYLVAPDDRLRKFRSEIARPTFASRQTPLHTICRFLPYSKLCARLEAARDVVRYLKPEFLDDIAILYDPVSEFSDRGSG